MKILVVGAGQVGRAVAVELAQYHDIVVVDEDNSRLDKLRFDADVLTLEGDGGDLDVLKEAGAEEADLLIACTDNDRVNILICGTARMLKEEVFTICRVADTSYLKNWEHSRRAFQVDFMVGSNLLTAMSIARIVTQELARGVEFFDQGRIEMAEFAIPEDCDFSGKKVQDCEVPEGLRFAAIFRGHEMEITTGQTELTPGARLLVIGESAEVGAFGRRLCGAPAFPPRGLKRLLARTKATVEGVFVLGGGEVGYQVARLLEEQGLSPRVVESDGERAAWLARKLKRSFVLHNDARNREFLKTEGVGRADAVVVALRPDERNLFTALLAKHLGAKRVLALVHDRDHQELFVASGIEETFNPRTEVIEEILRHTRSRQLEKIAFVEGHRGEVIEVELSATSPLVGRPLKEVMGELPGKMVIGAVSRSEVVIIPRGETRLRAGDDLVIFVDSTCVDELMEKL